MKTKTATEIVPQLLSEKDACRYLGVSRAWLANARSQGVRAGHAAPPSPRGNGIIQHNARN